MGCFIVYWCSYFCCVLAGSSLAVMSSHRPWTHGVRCWSVRARSLDGARPNNWSSAVLCQPTCLRREREHREEIATGAQGPLSSGLPLLPILPIRDLIRDPIRAARFLETLLLRIRFFNPTRS